MPSLRVTKYVQALVLHYEPVVVTHTREFLPAFASTSRSLPSQVSLPEKTDIEEEGKQCVLKDFFFFDINHEVFLSCCQ